MSKKIKKDVEAFARIKVVGVGGSGKNATNHMVKSKVKGVEFISVNTDAQDLHNSLAKKKVHIGKHLTKGLGTGMNADLGTKAAEETKEEIQETLKGADMIFISGGLGGGTCTGAAPIVAKVAKEMGALGVFDDKYEDVVKTYKIGNDGYLFSLEICGGPHVKNTNELGHFTIKKEESTSAGVRRIKAVLKEN